MKYTGHALTLIPVDRATKSPDIGDARGEVRTHRSTSQRLESELEKAQKDLADKEARMNDISGLALGVLRGT